MPVASVFILYVGTSAYDLRKVSSAVPHQTDPDLIMVRFIDEPRTVIPFDKATFEPAWEDALTANSGTNPIGPAGGDLGGTYPAPLVVGIQGTAVAATVPSGGAQLVFNAATNRYEPVASNRYFISGAAAQAAAGVTPFINGTFITIYPGAPATQAGIYQVTANGGIAFPADYTKVADATDTAAEVAIVDAGGYYPAPKNVESALQSLGAGLVLGTTGGPLLVGTTTIASIPIAVADGGDWSIILKNGTLRYKTTLAVTHDGGVASVAEYGGVPGPGVGVLPITFDADILAGNLRILAVAGAVGWSYRIRCLDVGVI
jgi:hypothetical protein